MRRRRAAARDRQSGRVALTRRRRDPSGTRALEPTTQRATIRAAPQPLVRARAGRAPRPGVRARAARARRPDRRRARHPDRPRRRTPPRRGRRLARRRDDAGGALHDHPRAARAVRSGAARPGGSAITRRAHRAASGAVGRDRRRRRRAGAPRRSLEAIEERVHQLHGASRCMPVSAAPRSGSSCRRARHGAGAPSRCGGRVRSSGRAACAGSPRRPGDAPGGRQPLRRLHLRRR